MLIKTGIEDNYVIYTSNSSNEDYFDLLIYGIKNKLVSGDVNEVINIEWCNDIIKNKWDAKEPFEYFKATFLEKDNYVKVPLDIFYSKVSEIFENLNPKSSFVIKEHGEAFKENFLNKNWDI